MGYMNTINDFVTMDLNEMRPEGFLETILTRQLTNIKAVNERHGWKKREYCPVCKSFEKEYQFNKYEFSLYQCKSCSTAYFDQIPVCTDDVYSSDHALNDAKTAYLMNKDYRKLRFANERIQLLENVLNNSIKDKYILDVGCGTGWFLEYAKDKGAICHGVELGKDLAQFTSEALKIPVWNCDLTELKTDSRFDVITMFDLIEHVVDPVQLVDSAKHLLKKDGIILIFTPQFDSVAIQTMKDKSNLIMPAEHLSYFTKKTVQFLSEKTKMEIVYFATKGIDIGDLKSFYEFQGKQNEAETMSAMYDILQPTIDASESGNHLRAILRK